EPVIVEDLRTERRFSVSPLLYEHEVVSSMSAVIHGRDKPFGVLGVYATAGHQKFTDDDVNFLQSVANVLATAVEREEAEEALANARRHSGASSVRVAAGDSGGKLWVEVSDNGRGFDPAKIPAGMGIRGMRERSRALGGDLRIKSEPGEGVTVRFELALEK